MINALLLWFVKRLLSLRYRVRLTGLEAVVSRGRRGILVLPNHPAIIDPLIVVAALHAALRPRPLADAEQMRHPLIAWFSRRVGVREIADLSRQGPDAKDQVAAVVAACAAGLQAGENILLYPSGHLQRTYLEDLRGNSAVEQILRQVPEARVVLVRTRGLWGSSFSFATGEFPNLLRTLRRHVATLLKNFIFFSPRRSVSVELLEPDDLPRNADRAALNAYLECFYNQDPAHSTYVPHTIWERGGIRSLPEPLLQSVAGSPEEVPAPVRRLVLEHLEKATGQTGLQFEQRLAQDLGLDSLARAELVLWLGQEFGFHAADVESLKTVADVVLAARGESMSARPVELQPIPPGWFQPRAHEPITIPEGSRITDVFLSQAARGAGRALLADQLTGVRSYRDLLTAVFALRPALRSMPGERIAILLPASVGATATYLAALFSSKTPVLLNWTTGARNMQHALELTGAERVLTVRPMIQRLESQGMELSAIRPRFVFMEDLRRAIGWWARLAAAVRARCSWAALRRAPVPDTIAILLTSGSEALPKAVPLTHANVLSNLRDMLTLVTLRQDDKLIGFLPPFHSFGLMATLLLPLLGAIRVVYHANPTEGWMLARLIEGYQATLAVGTPTFLTGIARSAQRGQLDTLRILVTGAEKCPEKTYALLAERAPQALVLEGYGVTECSPIIAANSEADPRRGAIGRLLPSYELALVDPETGEAATEGAPGLLLVRGPCVFGGYLGDRAASPFVEYAGRQWYRTGDLVRRDANGVLTFCGRLKRFVKLGGEMISLPAIEAVLLEKYGSDLDDGPPLAVVATAREDHPEIVLFTTREIDRAAANAVIRAAQLSALHNVTRVERIDAIPVLGTGKTDHRALQQRL